AELIVRPRTRSLRLEGPHAAWTVVSTTGRGYSWATSSCRGSRGRRERISRRDAFDEAENPQRAAEGVTLGPPPRGCRASRGPRVVVARRHKPLLVPSAACVVVRPRLEAAGPAGRQHPHHAGCCVASTSGPSAALCSSASHRRHPLRELRAPRPLLPSRT